MKNIKEIISKVLLVSVITSILPTSVFADTNENDFINLSSTRTTYIANTGTADTTILPPLRISQHSINGEVAYCMQGEKDYPVNIQYTLTGNYDSDAFVRGVTYYGYPNNATGLKEKHGLTDKQAEGMTQFALWYYFNPAYFAPKSHPYLDELRTLAGNSSPAVSLNLNTTKPTVYESGDLQVSQTITTGSNYSGTFTFPSDANVYSTDVNGNKKNTFNIGESFKVVAVGSYSGTVSKTISYSVSEPTMLQFTPPANNYQMFGKPSRKTTNGTASISVTFPGIVRTGDVIVNKTDDAGAPLQGVEFGLYSDSNCNTLVSRGTTNASGQVSFTGLNVGDTYYIKEISGLTGYIMDSSIKTVTVTVGQQTVNVSNTQIKGQIKITKSDSESNDVLQGAEFGIYNKSNTLVETIVTDSTGVATSSKLPYGEYTIRETKAPTGYQLSSREITVNITEHNKIYEYSYENDIIKGSIEVLKIDADTKNPLQGVKFGVFKTNDNSKVCEITTDGNGRAVTPELVYGNYYVKELQPLEGYVIDTTHYPANITTHGQVVSTTIENNKIKGAIKITKIEKGLPSTKLKGAEFTIYDENGGVVDVITTDDQGVATSKTLEYGEYTFKETKAPTGYVLSNVVINVSINENNKTYEFVYDNDYIRGYIELTKKDVETNESLAGVKFGVYNSANDTLVEEIITGADGIVRTSELRYGEYYIQEIQSLEGYVTDDTKHQIIITENLKVYPKEIFNRKIKGDLVILKYDAETGEPLANVQFEILCTEGFDKDKKFIVETDENGLAKADGLNYGEYEITEIKTLDGYILDSTPIPFTIDKDGQKIEKTVSNSRIVGDFSLLKYDAETKEPLANVLFTIECLSGFNKGDIQVIETDENGLYTGQDILYGEYEIIEIETIEGYVLDAEPIRFTIDEHGQHINVEKANKKIYGEVEFSKTDVSTGDVIDGAIIKINGIGDFNKDIQIEFESSSKGNYFTLPYGQYEIIEIMAPEGYVKTEEVGFFEILENGEIIQAQLKNERITGTLILTKRAEGTEKLLEGAEFGIYDEEGNLVTTVITDENGEAYVEGLYYGTYYYNEIKAPTGYLVDLDMYEFSIEYNNQIVEETVYNRLLNPFPDQGNENGKLPDAGGMNNFIVLLSMLAIGASVYFVKNYKMKNIK